MLCGAQRGDIRLEMWPWLEYEPGHQWDAGPRCTDRISCRGRVEDDGRRWEVDDRTPAPAGRRAQPMTTPAPGPAHDELRGEQLAAVLA